MRNSLLIILAILFITICLTSILVINAQSNKNQILQENSRYEKYLNKQIIGTELATLISKVVDENEKNNIQKDENGYYINNNKNSIKIDLKMITVDKTYPMEEIYKNEITKFVQNFNLIEFKCTNIEYHNKTGKIAKLTFEEIKN
ncbi:MAG: hypothetical protein Q4G09_01170 [Clostridia bacterium]|nr:hypothetical protein [Clostridia bacterium]